MATVSPHIFPAAKYAVPKRFGMAGILAITTFMAVLFGILRSMQAPPFLYIFLGLLAMVTCLVQMRYGDVPRMASIAVGAIFMPVCILMVVAITGSPSDVMAAICALPSLTLAGAGFGYLAGACTAGLFLSMDLASSYLDSNPLAGHRYERVIVTELLQPTKSAVIDPEIISSK